MSPLKEDSISTQTDTERILKLLFVKKKIQGVCGTCHLCSTEGHTRKAGN